MSRVELREDKTLIAFIKERIRDQEAYARNYLDLDEDDPVHEFAAIAAEYVLRDCRWKRDTLKAYDAVARRSNGAAGRGEAQAYRSLVRRMASLYADHPGYDPDWAT